MPDLLINQKTHEGVESVEIPLADGSGNASFVLPKEQTFLEQWFNSVCTYIGEYDIVTVTPEGEEAGYYYLSQCGLDVYNARMASDEINAQKAGNVALLVIPSSFDDTQNDLIAQFKTMITRETGALDFLTSAGVLNLYRSGYYGHVTTTNIAYTQNVASSGATVGDLPLNIKTTTTNPVLTASKARLYMVGYPFH